MLTIYISCFFSDGLDFGWDWGPAFVPAGIWRNMEVVAFDIGLITRVSPRVLDLGNSFFYVNITICAMIPKYSKCYYVHVPLHA